MISYSIIRNELTTGDLVLFSGKGAFSDIIKYGTINKFSHIGMVMRIPEYDFLAIWECTPLTNVTDLDANLPRKAVQLVPLSDRVQKYSGDIAIRQLKGASLATGALLKLMDLRKQLRGQSYDRDKVQLLQSAADGPFGHNNEDLSSIFCSELVAEAYQCLGLLADDKPANEYTPADFTERNMRRLCGDFFLSDAVLVKDD
ncbi:hypothetical protein [Oceanicoccus sagamiensis]|uniref:Permuted papain-like amidase YaeF/Yiix C92 family enzyme n=1 Tax=Oceanicoccus sagamiensis TaxID=716816 RepID=A0A1X9NBS1_9GAMM|nr:hypothetical protein [Oceanicoccus sagamiensis]ARN74621.1 hypothetical protein BST96_11105 [Oceanicoccus sagamiensis]